MTHSWQDIVKQQSTFPTEVDLTSKNSFIPLPQLGVIHISGEEAQPFLQNLLTNDVNALTVNQSQLSGFCNAKGRLFAVFQLIRREDYYQIVLPKSMCIALQQRLTMFVLRTKVSISDESETMNCLGLMTDNKAITALSLSEDILINYEHANRYLCIVPQQQTSELLTQLDNQQWPLASNTLWEQYDIQEGIPTIVPETKEKFTPQQINLDLINGVSFNKGCYPGQEVVARLHYLGTPSRRMFIAQTEVDNSFTIGDEVSTESGDIAGHIVRTQMIAEHSTLLLLSLKLSEKNNPLFINKTIAVKLTAEQLMEQD